MSKPLESRWTSSRRLFLTSVLVLVAATLVTSASHAGLYDSDAESVKGGDIKDRDYWRAKWDSIRLEEALKERQPEGAILMAVIGQGQLLDDLIKKYPNDEDFKKWKARSQEIKGKIDPNANRGESFKPGSLWNEWNYREAYVNYNYGKIAIAQEDWETARDGVREADRHFQILRERVQKEDRVAAWPDGAAQWIKTTSTEVAQMQDTVAAKLK